MPRGSMTGSITVTHGHVVVNVTATQKPSGATYGCPENAPQTWGCVTQTLTCTGTAFSPEFAKLQQ